MSDQKQQAASLPRAIVGAAGLGLIPLALTMDTLAAMARGWRTESHLEQTFIFVCVAITALTVIMFASSPGRSMLGRRRVAFPLLALTLLSIFMVGGGRLLC